MVKREEVQGIVTELRKLEYEAHTLLKELDKESREHTESKFLDLKEKIKKFHV
jgi:hypothetical protein